MPNMYLALYAYTDPTNRISLARAREPNGVLLPPPANPRRAPAYHVSVKARLPRPGVPLRWTVQRLYTSSAAPTLNDELIGQLPREVKAGDRLRFTSQGRVFVFKSCPTPHTPAPPAGSDAAAFSAEPDEPTRRHVTGRAVTAVLVTETTTVPLINGVAYPLDANTTLNHAATGWNETTQRTERGWTLTTGNAAGHRTTLNGDLIPPFNTALLADGDRILTARGTEPPSVVVFHLTSAPAPAEPALPALPDSRS